MGQLAEFAANHPYLAIAVMASLAAVIFYELRLRAQSGTSVSPGEAVQLINRGAVVIDVRQTEAFSQGHIVNARNIRLREIETSDKAVKKPKGKALLTVCENGADSAKAASALRKAGFENVVSMRTGLAGWRSENLPLVN